MTDFSELAERYLILIEGGPPSNYSAWSPELPGCAATGATLWRRRYVGEAISDTISAAVSPAGDRVYVTGMSYSTGGVDDYVTIAYDAATGAQLWVGGYNGPASENDGAASVAVNPVTGAVYVTGVSVGLSPGYDYLTIGYSG